MSKQQHKRNVEGLRISAQKKSEACHKRADEAIRRLLREGRRVNFNTVSKEGKVSIPWLYKQEKLKERIQHLRGEKIGTVPIPRNERASDDSKNKIIIALRERLKEAGTTIKTQREQLKVAYGRLAAAGQT